VSSAPLGIAGVCSLDPTHHRTIYHIVDAAVAMQVPEIESLEYEQWSNDAALPGKLSARLALVSELCDSNVLIVASSRDNDVSAALNDALGALRAPPNGSRLMNLSVIHETTDTRRMVLMPYSADDQQMLRKAVNVFPSGTKLTMQNSDAFTGLGHLNKTFSVDVGTLVGDVGTYAIGQMQAQTLHGGVGKRVAFYRTMDTASAASDALDASVGIERLWWSPPAPTAGWCSCRAPAGSTWRSTSSCCRRSCRASSRPSSRASWTPRTPTSASSPRERSTLAVCFNKNNPPTIRRMLLTVAYNMMVKGRRFESTDGNVSLPMA
jgi:hypothetical protein